VELLEGIVRLSVPLCCLSLAATIVGRIGFWNIALDGQVLVAAILYVVGDTIHSWWFGAFLAVAAIWLLNAASIYLVVKRKFDGLLLGLGLLYVCYGVSRMICSLLTGNPGYATLRSSHQESIILMVIFVLAVTCIVAEHVLKDVRLSKVVSESPPLASLRAVPSLRMSQLNGLIATLLTAGAAIYLVEHSGSFSPGITGQKGFLALAIAGIVGHSGVKACLWAIGFGAGQKLVWEMSVPTELIEILPFIIVILLLVMRNRRKNKRTGPVHGALIPMEDSP